MKKRICIALAALLLLSLLLCALQMLVIPKYTDNREGALILTLETQLLLCDAALSNSGKRVGIVLVSEKTKAGYIAEIYRAKNGQRLASADFQYSGFPEAYMAGGRLFLVGQKGSFGYLWYGKIHLFTKTP